VLFSVIVVNCAFNLSVYFHFILFTFYQQTEAAKFLQCLIGKRGVCIIPASESVQDILVTLCASNFL
jgi:hypothetical protein